jgi:hypothetical protein
MSSPDPVRQPSEETPASPQSPDTVRFAGIANGRVAVKAVTLDEVVRRLDEMGADRQEVEIWEVAPDSDKVAYAWSCRRVPPEYAGNLPGRSLFAGNPVMQHNEELARKISEEARSNPGSPYAGKFVGILNGQVAVVAESWAELGRRFRPMVSNPAEALCVEASRDPDVVEDIWVFP